MATKTRMHRSAAVTAIALVLMTAGCGKIAEKASEKATEKAIESAAGEGVDVDLDSDGNVEIKTEDGSYSAGAGKVPDAWPDDVPLPDDLVVVNGTQFSDTSEGTTATVLATISWSVSEVMAFYADALSGWNETMSSTSSLDGADTAQAMYEKDGRTVGIIVNVGNGQTDITINHLQGVAE